MEPGLRQWGLSHGTPAREEGRHGSRGQPRVVVIRRVAGEETGPRPGLGRQVSEPGSRSGMVTVTGVRHSPATTQQTQGSAAAQGLSQKVSPQVRVRGTWLRWGRGSTLAEPPWRRPCHPRTPKDKGHPQLASSLTSPASLQGDALRCGCWHGQTGLTSLAEKVALALSAVHDKHPESNVPLLRGQTTAFGSLGMSGQSCPPPCVNTGPQIKKYCSKEPVCSCVRDQEMPLWSAQVAPSG